MGPPKTIAENKYYTPSENRDDCGGTGPDTDCAGVCFGDAAEDCAGECNGSAVVDDCGVCNGTNADDLGCGCFEAGPSGCDNECGSTLENDECSVCGGDSTSCADCAGTPNGDAVLDDCGVCNGGNADDLGCGCFEPGPSGCDNECGSTAELDECGVCGGNGPAEGYDCDGIPELFTFNQSTQQAFYYFYAVTLNGDNVEADDWVGAFNGDICVGSRQWDTSLCNNGICDVFDDLFGSVPVVLIDIVKFILSIFNAT